MRLFTFVCLFSVSLFLMGCSSESDDQAEEGKAMIVCTTGMLGDMLKTLGSDYVDVQTLMGPGVDPHLYKATPGDLKKLRSADFIIYNGWHLEGKMVEVLEKLATTKPVLAVAEQLPQQTLLQFGDDPEAIDPHVWFDVDMWQECGQHIASFLIENDPANATIYKERLVVMEDSLNLLDIWVSEEVGSIPEEQRVLITAHDAFSYFGQAYAIDVKGLQGISTVAEFGLRDVSDMVSFITERKIKAVFVESSIPKKSLEAVVRGCAEKGHTVAIGGTLYSDAMGEAGTPAGTYAGMVRANVNTIVEALK
ncbi:MAG: zinc ABC transporter substrate-binding protein [Bacteroidota bacterium]